MSLEPMRAALERWGDPIYRLALLMTGRANAAERVTEATFRRAFAKAPPDVEQALYSALAQAGGRRRIAPGRSVLPGRSPWRIPPRDRLLLALWLLAEQSGEQLTAIFGVSPEQLVARLDRLLSEAAAAEAPPHLARSDWLRRELFGDETASAHLRLCAECRDSKAGWQARADELARQLRSIAGDARLPRPVADALRAEPSVTPAPRRGRLYAVILAVVCLLLMAIIVPWPRDVDQETAAALTPAGLVQAALAEWQTAPSAAAQHRRVRAVPLWSEDEPLILDVWQSAAGRHRWEAHSGNVLVEWQLGDGSEVLRYGAVPEHASCRWRAGRQARMVDLREGGLHFAAPPEQQREALAGRLREGAYGTGYVLLQRAQVADDLLSLGRRETTSGSVTVLRFTDRLAEPPRQLVLEIDARNRLHAAQAVADGGQTTPRDLWRVLLDEAVDQVPPAAPDSAVSATPERLIDPACPSVEAETVLSPRELAFVSGLVVLPAALPDGASAALFSRYGVGASTPSMGRAGNIDLVVTRPGSRLTLEFTANGWASSFAPNQSADATTIEGSRWRLVLERGERGSRTGWIEPREATSAWGALFRVSSSGWSKDELAALVEGLELFDILNLAAHQARFWDPAPLPEPIADVLYGAIEAERPASGVLTRGEMEVETRVVGGGATGYELTDPYANAMEYRTPPRILLRRVTGNDPSGAAFGRFESVLPDGTMFRFFATDQAQFVTYDAQSRRVDRYPASPYTEQMLSQPLQLSLVALLLGAGEHVVNAGDDAVTIERRWPLDADTLPVQPNWVLPYPVVTGLPEGSLLARLTLVDNRVTAFELLHQAVIGDQTLLQRAVVTDGGQAPTELSDVLALPPLDDDVLILEAAADGSMRIVVPSQDWIGRTYGWPAAIAAVVNDTTPVTRPSTLGYTQLQNASWQRPGVSQLWRVTEYSLAADGISVTLTQGPSAVLGFILRHGNGFRWTRSEALPVSIGGQERQGWLLSNSTGAVLVVELDGLLLHVGVPAAGGSTQPGAAETLLRGPVRESLAQLAR